MAIICLHRIIELEETTDIIYLNCISLEMWKPKLRDAHLKFTALSYAIVFQQFGSK